MSYAFQKVYADLVARDGTVCVAYLTWVRLLGRWYARSGLELYAPDGARRVLSGGPVPLFDPAAGGPLRFSIPTPGGEVVVEYAPTLSGYAPAAPARCPSLRWMVLVPRAPAQVDGPGVGTLQGEGYADWVQLTRVTRVLGFRELRWGRAHPGTDAAAFVELAFDDGDRWCAGATWTPPARTPLAVAVRCAWPGGSADGEVRLGDATLALRAHRVLHQGDAFGAERVSRPLDRWVARALGGRTREVRWAGEGSLGASTGPALWERVRFGGGG